MRMSSGPSIRKLKPRSASSSWCDETPKSSKRPCAPPSGTSAASAPPGPRTALRCRKSDSAVAKPPLSTAAASRPRAVASACGSRSTASNFPPASLIRSRIAAECPPPPSVPSTYVPPGSQTNASHTSRTITGVWYSEEKGRSSWPGARVSDPEGGSLSPLDRARAWAVGRERRPAEEARAADDTSAEARRIVGVVRNMKTIERI
mmetsp:Transcript_31564/g.70943  ORF Transcript_31564/g.70943 Transcript_31564/m.70943 type:complete len:205 (+) Transcript_31564:876-1490(+)